MFNTFCHRAGCFSREALASKQNPSDNESRLFFVFWLSNASADMILIAILLHSDRDR